MSAVNAMARRSYPLVTALALMLLASLAAVRAIEGQVPTAADFAACNDEAPRAVKAGIASPIPDDHIRADRARSGVATTNSAAPLNTFIHSSDPQIDGMEAEGAKSAVYQAAYRSCMRRKGF